jgi:hypothetical protein
MNGWPSVLVEIPPSRCRLSMNGLCGAGDAEKGPKLAHSARSERPDSAPERARSAGVIVLTALGAAIEACRQRKVRERGPDVHGISFWAGCRAERANSVSGPEASGSARPRAVMIAWTYATTLKSGWPSNRETKTSNSKSSLGLVQRPRGDQACVHREGGGVAVLVAGGKSPLERPLWSDG